MLLENEIRILDILPYGPDGPQGSLKCEIRVETLSNYPVYDALSYRWGDPGRKRCILVDNQEFFVTRTLYAALLRLRQKDNKQSLWIDQICIDQNNLVEKAIQVRLVGKIYLQCNQCLIWVEEIDDSIPLAHAEAIIEMFTWMADSSHLPVPACLASLSDFQGPCKALNSVGPFDNSWWHRIWTVQEAIIPAKKSLLWGPYDYHGSH
ncbi:heterokaryon incompatibility protein-domain-containing protein [Cadophora sp. MPI-SDFR-AT-0126]|nr:heterokaryon incompatibility protein-domain-containing protein [Leotiomycetes sp. MPI-SDFR-AT-0126]